MRVRLRLIDVTAAILVAFVVLLPARSIHVESAYFDHIALQPLPARSLNQIAALQAKLARDPTDLSSMDRLTEILNDLGLTDESLRIAGTSIEPSKPSHWPALVTISATYADRIEFRTAREWLTKALESCQLSPGGCRVDQRARMEIYADELDRAIAAIDEGIDPRADPQGFRNKVQAKQRPPIRVN